MKNVFLILTFLVTFLSSVTNSSALDVNIVCDDRYLTLVNPVRSRALWFDHSLKPIEDQYKGVKDNNFKATWLIQYDVLKDPELVRYIKNFKDQEVGVFLEVSKIYADRSKVIYPYNKPWFNPGAVFLSGYAPSERKKLIDSLFKDFRKEFGYYPKSVGAWWIDSYSLSYLESKYSITSAMIVADQLTTDSYGVWGQWWGAPYYPSKVNPLIPAKNISSKLPVVIIQWAQRDPNLAYGAGPAISNFSLQANDYIRQGKDTKYFAEISNAYLSCQNKLGQITVGLETGIESFEYIEEYLNQLKYLKSSSIAKSVTMSEFASEYSKIFPNTSEKFVIEYKDSVWNMTTKYRENTKLNNKVVYKDQAFTDTYLADKSDFLNRNLQKLETKENKFYFPIWLVLLLGFCLYLFFNKKNIKVWTSILLFVLTSYLTLFRSFSENGYQIFYGPKVPNLVIVQVLILVIAILVTLFLLKKKMAPKNNWFWVILPLTYGLDYLISLFRYTKLANQYYFGISRDAFNFTGVKIASFKDINFINQDFEAYQAAALLRLDFNKLWDNLILSLIAYPLTHILLAIVLHRIFVRLNSKLRIVFLILLLILTCLWFIKVIHLDPRIVV